ncbi:MAG: aminoglycoside phosphotransferase family protein [Alphaproteobacteria bacterium]
MMHKDKLELIKKAQPNLDIKTAEFIESGFHSLAIIINNEWVFRFPLSPDFYQEYIQEEKVLNCIHSQVETKVPLLKLHQIGGVMFTQHKMILGTQYTFASSQMNKEEKEELASELANFLVQMHHSKIDIPIGQTILEEYPCLEKTQRFTEIFSSEEIKKLQHLLKQYKEYERNLNPKDIVLCHTDLNENNFIIKNRKLEGVIDFGNACLCDSSFDFAPLLKHDFALVQRIAAYYEQISGRKVNLEYAEVIQKLRCYGGILNNYNDSKRVARYNRWLKYIEENEVSSFI